jgi:hypothetical protein
MNPCEWLDTFKWLMVAFRAGYEAAKLGTDFEKAKDDYAICLRKLAEEK